MQKIFFIAMFCIFKIAAQNPLDEFYKNKPDGITELKNPDGVRVVFSKARGHLHGMYYEFYPDGKVATKVLMDNGKYQDTAWTYSQSGAAKAADVFHSDTLVFSQQDSYFSNGKLSDLEQFILKPGIPITSIKTGKIQKDKSLIYHMISDNRSSFKKVDSVKYVHISFYKNGINSLKEEFVNNKREGVQINYYKNGKVYSNENYVKGRREGKQYYFDTNGVTSEQCYQRGIKYACDPN